MNGRGMICKSLLVLAVFLLGIWWFDKNNVNPVVAFTFGYILRPFLPNLDCLSTKKEPKG